MGLPALNIIFKSAAVNTIMRAQRGIIGMIVKDTVPDTNPIEIFKERDIPTTLSDTNQAQIKRALIGNITGPKKIVVYVLATAAEDYKAALDYFSVKRVNILCCPTVKTDNQLEAVTTWVKAEREARDRVKAVLPETVGDNEGIINYATTSAKAGEDTFTAEQYCSRIAGLIAGTPATSSCTFAVLPEVSECTVMTREEAGAAIEAGKLILFYDGEKVKIARGVNSLTTTTPEKAAPWKKIKVVETMDTIHDDLLMHIEDNYIGKYANTINNKFLLLSAIDAYFKELERLGLLEGYVVDLDVDAIRDYIVTYKGVKRDDAEAMADAEVKRQYTDDKVFMTATMNIVDVMEDITLNITM